MNETRIFGPPGTGKTTYLSRQVALAAEAVGGDRILVASFTKAAARELISRELPVTPEMVGTLHALAYRALGRPILVEGHLREWGEAYPHWGITRGTMGSLDEDDGEGAQGGDGDALYRAMEIARARMIPVDQWPAEVARFGAAWNKWKGEHNLKDFTDLIETCLKDKVKPFGQPSIGFFDEVQDFTALELALVRQWGEAMERIILAGDDDQCLYRFKGASPDAFLSPPVEPQHRRVLGQSYRVPVAVHARAARLLTQISRREPKAYLPRDHAGAVLEGLDGTWSHPEAIVEDAARRATQGQTVMILASTSYFLRPTIACLREAGLPFHNPYRRRRGDWNPLAIKDGSLSASELLRAFLSKCKWNDYWTVADFLIWIKQMKVEGCMVPRKGRTEVQSMELQRELEAQDDDAYASAPAYNARKVLLPEALERALARDLDWFTDHLKTTRQRGVEYPIKIIRKQGTDATFRVPRICIGTIHAVKGGEADVVYLMPDLSPSAAQEYHGSPEERDSVLRMFYVGMTRAKDTLILIPPNVSRKRPTMSMEE